MIGQREIPGLLAVGAPPLGAEMMPVQLAEALGRELPEPGVIGQRPGSQILLKVLGRVKERILDDIGRIDPGGQAAIEPHGHHPRQAVLEPQEQLLTGCGVAPACAVDEDLGVRRCLGHGGIVL